MHKYQYHAFNEHMDFLVTVPIESCEYAEGFAQRTAIDFFDYTKEQVKDLKVEFICKLSTESVINLKLLNEEPSNT